MSFNIFGQVDNIFLTPPGQGGKARAARRQFEVAEGDLLTLLNVYNAFRFVICCVSKSRSQMVQ